MDYNIFWASHINKADITEIEGIIVITDEVRKRLKKKVAFAPARVLGEAIDRGLVKSKGIPLGVKVTTERCKSPDGYEVKCVVQMMGNKGWRNWFPLPIVLRREQFKEIDKIAEEAKLSIQNAIEPLLLDA